VGRDYDSIRKTWSPEVFVRETEADLAQGRSMWGEPFESWRAGNLVGTPEQVAEKVRQYVDLGCTGFVPWCADYPDVESLELFATKVMPEFR
jgi:alkanesulfonate monooxygenase SsuD/methylene tetrahydromethanopterin reductase-like flavin-dependent oxidoreductase (luciferase family)